MKIGISVTCTVCHRTKNPHGRSAPDAMYGSRCNDECSGYNLAPLPGCLWPGETEEDFGYTICHHATRDAESRTSEPVSADERFTRVVK